MSDYDDLAALIADEWSDPMFRDAYRAAQQRHQEAVLRSGYARRDALIVPFVNLLLRLTSERYRAMLNGSIRLGLKAAADDESAGVYEALRGDALNTVAPECDTCKAQRGHVSGCSADPSGATP